MERARRGKEARPVRRVEVRIFLGCGDKGGW